jgi:hypothetical protein
MGPVSHYLFGALFGALVACVAVVFRRRWVLYMPPFILACGFWAEMPYLLGIPGTRHPLANLFFGYAALHPWLQGREFAGFVLLLVLVNALILGYVVFLTWYFWTVDSVRWERKGWEGEGRLPSHRRHSVLRERKE